MRSRFGVPPIVAALLVGAVVIAGAFTRSEQVEVVDATNGSFLPGAAALFHGRADGSCQRFPVVEVATALPWTAPTGDAACPLAVTAFAPGFRPQVAAGGPNRSDAWRLELKPALELEVRRWVVAEHASDDLALVDQVLSTANGTLHIWRAGVTLIDGGRTDLSRTDPNAAVIGYGCGQVDAIRAAADLYVAGKLNVYFVAFIMVPDSVEGRPVGNRLTVAQGINCGAVGAPEIIFLSYWLAGAAILEHELGHAMGFWQPNGGHAEPGTPGMEANFMQDGGVSGGGKVTLGQVYRMQFDAGSWLQLSGQADAALKVTCQDDRTSDDPCPRFSRGSDP